MRRVHGIAGRRGDARYAPLGLGHEGRTIESRPRLKLRAALVEALESGHLGGAGLDVFDDEPLPPDAPILRCRQVVLTPHSADQNPEGRDLLNSGAVQNILAFLRGEPQNVVN